MIAEQFDLDAMLAQARLMRPRLIGFCGLAGSGKSWAATHLASSWGYSRVRFAGPLKDMMRALGLNEAEIEGDRKESPCDLLGGRTPRQAMQTLGTEWGREQIDPELWVRAWERAAAKYLDNDLPVVVDDVRYLNEAAAIWRRGGTLVRIDRAGAGSASGASHASESGGLPWNLQITNCGEARAFGAVLDGIVHLRGD